jgi:Zn-dependent protease
MLLFSSYLFLLWILVFLFVTLHELTHSIVAKRMGIRVKRILLIAIGGIAMMDVSNIKPMNEIKMAIAGPLFNLSLCAIMIFVAFSLNYPLLELTQTYITNVEAELPFFDLLWVSIFWINLLLGSFNLFVPAFPLDGGRVLRGIMALRMDYVKATDIARKLSYGLAAGIFLVSFLGFGSPIWMLLISLFIVVGATSEYRNLVTSTALRKLNISKFVVKNYMILKPSETLASAVRKFGQKRTTSAVVSSRPIKILNINDIAAVPKNKWKTQKVGKTAVHVRPMSLFSHPDDVFQKMTELGRGMIPVTDRGKMKGVILYEDLERALRIGKILGQD